MVFQSLPVYLDPPNWNQQGNQQPSTDGTGAENPQLPPRPPLPPPPSGVSGGGAAAGSLRPGSMADRARLAKIPQPEAALKCPRCESTNTKFCYFNNYSLTQPRHFCKTCRRYWTRGGALRNVPVGGGCRRNKRSKSNSTRSKSPVIVKTGSGFINSNGGVLGSNSCTTDDMTTGHIQLPPPAQLPIFPPLHHLGDFNPADIGLNFSGIHPPPAAATCGGGGGAEFQINRNSTSTTSGGGSILCEGLEQWRLQQFPNFLANLDSTSNGLYPFDQGVDPPNFIGQLRTSSKQLDAAAAGVLSQLAAVKMEENNNNGGNQGLNLSRNFLGISGNDQYNWGGNNAWTTTTTITDHHPGFASSTSHLI